MKENKNDKNTYLDKMKALGERTKQNGVKKPDLPKATVEKKMIKPEKTDRETRRINTVRANREINKGIIDGLIARKHCPLLTNKFDCGKRDGYNLKKGKEPQCHCPDFVNCPGYDQYTNHEVRADRRNVGGAESRDIQKNRGLSA